MAETIISMKKGDKEISWPEVDKAYADALANRDNLTEQYKKKMENINFNKGVLTSFKQFAGIHNWYHKGLTKEINVVDNIINDKLRQELIYANADFKKLINIDYPAVKKYFAEQDSYLKPKVSDAYAVHAATKKK